MKPDKLSEKASVSRSSKRMFPLAIIIAGLMIVLSLTAVGAVFSAGVPKLGIQEHSQEIEPSEFGQSHQTSHPDIQLADNRDRRSGFGVMFGNNPNLIADVAEQMAPSVVNIDISKRARRPAYDSGVISPFEDEIFRRFFGFEQGQSPFRHYSQRSAPKRVIQGNGSGVIIDKKGHILTNNHVIQGADEVQVTLNDGRVFPAKKVGSDRFSDIAVLKIEADNLVPAPLGDSEKLRPGEWVIAVGSPLGFDHTVTLGIISAISRRVPDINVNLDFIQTDAAINPGNSGGPLVNLHGEVVGINTAISGRGQNIGFAIPANVARNVSEILITEGNISRPWIGIAMSKITPELARSLGLSKNTVGVIVAQVMPGSPAEQGGFRYGDIIQRVDGKKVGEAKNIQNLVQGKPIDTTLNFQIIREGRLMALPVKTAKLPDNYQHR